METERRCECSEARNGWRCPNTAGRSGLCSTCHKLGCRPGRPLAGYDRRERWATVRRWFDAAIGVATVIGVTVAFGLIVATCLGCATSAPQLPACDFYDCGEDDGEGLR